MMFSKIKKAVFSFSFWLTYLSFVMLLWLAVGVLAGDRVSDAWMITITIVAYELFAYIKAEREKKEAERDMSTAAKNMATLHGEPVMSIHEKNGDYNVVMSGKQDEVAVAILATLADDRFSDMREIIKKHYTHREGTVTWRPL